MMKKLQTSQLLAGLCFILFALLVGLGLQNVGIIERVAQEEPQAESYELPELELATLTAEELTNNDFADKLLIVSFWASWCAPCLRDFPLLLDATLDPSNRAETVLLAISSDYEFEEMQSFLFRFPAALRNRDQVKLVWDPDNKIGRTKFNVIFLPETFIFAKNKIIAKLVGELDKEEFEAALTKARGVF